METTKRKKRLRTVFKNSLEVCQSFASQSQEVGCAKYNSRDGRVKGGESIYFRGTSLYSFGSHFLLAKVGLTIGGVPVAVVNESHYSMSTTRHTWEARASLVNAGFFVVSVSGDGITASTPDAGLIRRAIECLEAESARLTQLQVDIQSSPYFYGSKEIRRDIRAHNSMVTRLGLKRLVVRIDEIALAAGRKFYRRYCIARAEFQSRRQVSLLPGLR